MSTRSLGVYSYAFTLIFGSEPKETVRTPPILRSPDTKNYNAALINP